MMIEEELIEERDVTSLQKTDQGKGWAGEKIRWSGSEKDGKRPGHGRRKGR